MFDFFPAVLSHQSGLLAGTRVPALGKAELTSLEAPPPRVGKEGRGRGPRGSAHGAGGSVRGLPS